MRRMASERIVFVSPPGCPLEGPFPL